MIRFLAVRALTLLAGLFLASLIIFISLRLLPGDVAQVIGGTSASPAQVEAIRERLGLNVPLPLQYLDWLGGVFTGQLGSSVVSGTSIAAEIAEKAQVTVPLTLYSLTIALIVALPLGVFAAYRRQALPSRVLSVLGVVAAAVPAVWALPASCCSRPGSVGCPRRGFRVMLGPILLPQYGRSPCPP